MPQHPNKATEKSNMSVHEKLLAEIKSRKQVQTLFGEGIITADRYVKTVLDCVGSDICYRYAATKETSFDDVMKKAAKTLVYRNEDMILEGAPVTQAGDFKMLVGGDDEVEMPKNTLMAFKHCLTTPRKDRDGDVLRTDGAIPDPKMLLLWQHIHTLPVGKMLMIAEHSAQKLSLVSAIVDMNELSHDAAVMVDNDMARFSHGFRALQFEELKAEEGETTSPGGFDVKRFEIMEESVVSVPSNTDAEVEEVILGLVEGSRLTSGIMKEYGAQIRSKRPVRVAVTDQLGDFKRIVEANSPEQLAETVKALDDEKQRTGQEESSGKGCGCGGDKTGTPEQKDGDAAGAEGGKKESKDSEVKSTLIYRGQIKNSWEHIEAQLDNKCSKYFQEEGELENRYCWRLATFADSVIFCCEHWESGHESEYKYFRKAWESDEKGNVSLTGEKEELDLEISIEESKAASPHTKEKDKTEEQPKIKEAIAFVMMNADQKELRKMAQIVMDQKKAEEKKQTRERFRKFLRS